MTKRGKIITISVVAVCICAAVYLNWAYNRQMNADETMAAAELSGAKAAEEQAVETSAENYISDYFAEARLTRQESRDEALSLLQAATTSENATQETIDAAVNSIAAMAASSMRETQIENLLLAKSFAECVAYISGDGVTLAVPAPAEGLTAEEVARITDAVTAETDFGVSQIKVIEVKAPADENKTVQKAGEAAKDGAAETERAAVEQTAE